MRQIFIAAFLLTWTVMSFGQHFIKGKVIDENGGALVGASVLIKSESLGKPPTNKVFLFSMALLKRVMPSKFRFSVTKPLI